MNLKSEEILRITQEESAEVIQAISKIFRFGLNNYKPGQQKTNKEHLEEELGDLLAMVELITENGIVSVGNMEKAKIAKFEKLKKWSNI